MTQMSKNYQRSLVFLLSKWGLSGSWDQIQLTLTRFRSWKDYKRNILRWNILCFNWEICSSRMMRRLRMEGDGRHTLGPPPWRGSLRARLVDDSLIEIPPYLRRLHSPYAAANFCLLSRLQIYSASILDSNYCTPIHLVFPFEERLAKPKETRSTCNHTSHKTKG